LNLRDRSLQNGFNYSALEIPVAGSFNPSLEALDFINDGKFIDCLNSYFSKAVLYSDLLVINICK
jgi:hypothetical protein